MKSALFGMVAGGFALALAGCGGGGEGATGPGSYETLLSTAPATSTLGGVSFQLTGGGARLAEVTGTTRHNSGATTISDGSYTLSDANGVDANFTLTDGVAVFDGPAPGTLGTRTYEYVGGFTFRYPGTTSRVVGGIITQAPDVPTSGNASYFGDAQGGYITSTQAVLLDGGTASVAVNFGTGLVDAAMTGFSGRDAASGTAVGTPLVDAMTATAMTLSGNRFGGGTLTMSQGGVAVTPTGGAPTDSASGAFFGYDSATAQPAEVGGAVLSKGAQTTVYGLFVAK